MKCYLSTHILCTMFIYYKFPHTDGLSLCIENLFVHWSVLINNNITIMAVYIMIYYSNENVLNL